MAAGSLLVDIGMNIARLQQDMGKATRLFATGMKQMSGDVSFLKNSLVGLVSVGSLVSLGKSAMDLGGQLTDMSSKFGVAASDLSALSLPAKMVGVDVEAVGNAFKFMQKNIAAAENETSDQATALKILGVGLEELRGKTPMEQFLRLSEAFSRLEKDENRTALALELFGKAGADILPVLGQGEAAIVKAMNAAKDMGIALRENEIKALDDYGDAYDRTAMKIKSFAGRAVLELGDWFSWMFTYNKMNVEQVDQLSAAWERVLIKAGMYNPSIKTGKIADILQENPDKVKAGNLEKEKERIKREAEATKKAAGERKKLLDEYAKLHSANLAREGEEVHAALAAEMGMSQEYHDTVTKMDMDEFAEWKKRQEEELDLLAKFDMEKIAMLKDLQDAQRAEMESDAPATPYLFEDAMRAAEAYGNVSLAIQTMNSDLGAQYSLVAEGQSYIALYQQAWMDANLAIAESMTTLYSGLQNWISTSIQGLVEGTITIQNVLANLGKMLLQMVTDYIAKWIASRLFMTAMEKTIAATSMAMDKVYMLAYVGNKIAEATASTGAGAARALSEYSWPYSAVVAAAVMAEGAAIIAGMTVGAAAAGAAHGGLDYVPAETTYLLDRGERVISPRQNEDLTNFLGGGGGNGQTIILQMDEGVLARWVNKAQRTGIVRLVPT